MPASPTIEETLLIHLRPGMAPRDLMKAVRAIHPEATKREIIGAAFSTVILMAEDDPERARELQDFALKARGD